MGQSLAECAAIDFLCEEGEVHYADPCTCGCIAVGSALDCEQDDDCVPEDCCRPTGCVAAAFSECQQEPCCDCDGCLPAVSACGCVDGLCRTWYDVQACE